MKYLATKTLVVRALSVSLCKQWLGDEWVHLGVIRRGVFRVHWIASKASRNWIHTAQIFRVQPCHSERRNAKECHLHDSFYFVDYSLAGQLHRRIMVSFSVSYPSLDFLRNSKSNFNFFISKSSCSAPKPLTFIIFGLWFLTFCFLLSFSFFLTTY